MAAPHLVAVILLLTLLGLVSLRLPHPFVKRRTVDSSGWEAHFGSEHRATVDAALESVCHAFLIRREHADRLHPDDRLIDIYRAAYPIASMPDTLEFESLHLDLTRSHGVPEGALARLGEMTIRDVVELCVVHAGTRTRD